MMSSGINNVIIKRL